MSELATARLYAAGILAVHPPSLSVVQRISDERYAQLMAAHSEGAPATAMAHAESRSAAMIAVVGRRAVITITGAMTKRPDPILVDLCGAVGYEDLARAVDMVSVSHAQGEIDTLVLDIDSPGGAVTGVRMVVEAISRCSARTIAYTDGQMCSAAYWIGVACDRVVASSTGRIGSVGAISSYTMPASDDAEQRWVFVSAGSALKGWDPTDEQLAHAQSTCDDMGAVFASYVATRRGIVGDNKAKSLGFGGVFVAKTALEMGLIDEVVSGLPEGDSMSDHDEKDTMPQRLAEALDEVSALKIEASALRVQAEQLAEQLAHARLAAEDAQMRQTLSSMLAAGQLTPHDIHGDGQWDGEAVDAWRGRETTHAKTWRRMESALPSTAIDMATHTRGGTADEESRTALVAEIRAKFPGMSFEDSMAKWMAEPGNAARMEAAK